MCIHVMYMYTCSSEGGGSCSSLVYTPSRAYRRLGLAEVLQLGLGVVAAEEAALLTIEGQRARDERHSLQPAPVRRMEHGVRQRDHGGAARRRRRAAAGLEGAEMLFKLQWRRRRRRAQASRRCSGRFGYPQNDLIDAQLLSGSSVPQMFGTIRVSPEGSERCAAAPSRSKQHELTRCTARAAQITQSFYASAAAILATPRGPLLGKYYI